MVALYQALGCHFRCISPDYECTTTVNLQPFSFTSILNLEDGDYVEVFVIQKRLHSGVLSLLASYADYSSLDLAERQEVVDPPGQQTTSSSILATPVVSRTRKLTAVGIHTEDNLGLRSDAAPEETCRSLARSLPLSTANTDLVTAEPMASDSDSAVFMQRSAVSRTSDRVYMRFVGLHGYFTSRFVDLSQSLSSQLEDGWSRIRRISQPIVNTHTVEYPPTVSGTSYPMTIVQYQDDYYEQINDDDVLAVITVVLQEPERKEKLKVHWIPLKMTRQGFIFFTRMQGYCDRLEVLCTVYHNGQLWHDESNLRRRMQHGDHLRLHLRSSCFIWSDFEFAESLERRRRLFGSSSEEEGETHREPERSRPSSHRAERSRSRNRYGEGGGDRPFHSLLQIGWNIIRHPIHAQEAYTNYRCGLTCEMQPHVSDRWCVVSHRLPNYIPLQDDLSLLGHPWSLTHLRPPGNPIDLMSLDDVDEALNVVDYVPDPPFVSCSPPGCIDRVWELLSPWRPGIFSHDFSEVTSLLLPVASAFLEASQPQTFGEPTYLSVLIDGSTTSLDNGDSVASYAIVPTVTLISPSGVVGYQVCGHCGGILAIDPAEPFWTGADTANSLDAERTGIILAICWILQSDMWHEVPVELVFDCTSAGYTAAGDWNVDRGSLVALMLRSMGQVLHELCGSTVSYRHVKGHSGDPGNELVDAVAKAYAKLLIPGRAEGLFISDLTCSVRDEGPWLWMGIVRHAPKGDLPWMSTDRIRLPQPGHPPVDTKAFSFSPTAADSVESTPLLTLTLATLNIRGVFGHDQQDQRHEFAATKGGYIAEQFLYSAYDIVGLQEAYTTDVGVGRFHGYMRVVGGADANKNAGCELWIAEKLPFGSCNPQTIAVLFQDPRCLAVRLTLSSFDGIFCVGYAPHTGVSKADAQLWWTKMQQLVSVCQAGTCFSFDGCQYKTFGWGQCDCW